MLRVKSFICAEILQIFYMSPEVFISYSRNDQEKVCRVAEKLKAHGDAVRAIETQLKSTESDEEAAELIQELKQLQRAGLELRHQAIDRIAAFIGYRRAGMIKQVEREFRTRVMKRRMNWKAT